MTGDVRPSVSVVVPVLNAADSIGPLCASLEKLDWPRDRFEAIVVDNGSTDATREIVARHAVTLVEERAVRGSYAARNRGWRAARGAWIAFTDADCVAPADWLSKLLAAPPPAEAGAVLGEVVALEEESAVQRLTERYGIMKHAVTMPHKQLPCFSTANVAIRRDVLEKLGGFRDDVRFFGDMEMSWRMQIELGVRLEFRPEAAVLHRHRRSWGALWRQGVQHGRGVAFMRRTYPDRYEIRLGEQVRRIAGLAGAAGRAAAGPGADRWAAPIFLALWYGGMLAGLLRGPAWSDGR